MKKVVIHSGTIDSEPVGFKKGCGRCPSGCRTACQRYKTVNFDIIEGDMDEFEVIPVVPDYGSFRRKAEPKE